MLGKWRAIIRVPRSNDKTGLPAGAFDATTLRDKVWQRQAGVQQGYSLMPQQTNLWVIKPHAAKKLQQNHRQFPFPDGYELEDRHILLLMHEVKLPVPAMIQTTAPSFLRR